jgi:hypothetical protein
VGLCGDKWVFSATTTTESVKSNSVAQQFTSVPSACPTQQFSCQISQRRHNRHRTTSGSVCRIIHDWFGFPLVGLPTFFEFRSQNLTWNRVRGGDGLLPGCSWPSCWHQAGSLQRNGSDREFFHQEPDGAGTNQGGIGGWIG